MALVSPPSGTWLWLAAFVVALVAWVRPAYALDVPPLRAHVNDQAGMLSATAQQQLEQLLSDYEAKTQQQFALLTVESLDGDAIEDFAVRVFEKWQLGQKGKDDGLLLVIAERDRRLKIEVGYGLEGDVTDAFSARVIRNVLTPALRAGQAEQGITQAFRALMQKASGQVVDSRQLQPAPQKKRGSSGFGALALLLGVLPLLLLFGGRRGGGGGAAMAGWVIGSMMGSSGRGGGWGGGGGGWGGGGGGGWGGGGGGGSGGGGASGSW